MRHLQIILGGTRQGARKTRPAQEARQATPFKMNNCPKLCWGCAQPFPVREGCIEAQVGQDLRLYCFAMTPSCAARAVKPVVARAKQPPATAMRAAVS
jgi:hypothetical protein